MKFNIGDKVRLLRTDFAPANGGDNGHTVGSIGTVTGLGDIMHDGRLYLVEAPGMEGGDWPYYGHELEAVADSAPAQWETISGGPSTSRLKVTGGHLYDIRGVIYFVSDDGAFAR